MRFRFSHSWCLGNPFSAAMREWPKVDRGIDPKRIHNTREPCNMHNDQIQSETKSRRQNWEERVFIRDGATRS
jgi:hypothetical protein